jgi:tripartite-type tricarboxylate transporter receptor subunit TctC
LPSWLAEWFPALTPKPIVDRLNVQFAKALAVPRVQDFLRSQTLMPGSSVMSLPNS